jgi:hypothetical protein
VRNPLHALCPYFAMFPESFAEKHIRELTDPEDYVLDPFSGRGTTLLQSLLMGRHAAAVDINPVAFCISGAKAAIPSLESVIKELSYLEESFAEIGTEQLKQERAALPPFFRMAFYESTLYQILFLRAHLNWRGSPVHRFIAALVLGSLHGDSSSYFSNQMPRTISTKPRYSIKYWRTHKLWPHKRDVFAILRSRATYRLSGELPEFVGRVALCDARNAAKRFPTLREKIKLVVTSPPYLDVTNYEEDQWLRLWFLGHEPKPTYNRISKDDRYGTQKPYWEFLTEVWQGIAPMVRSDSSLVCRLGAKGMKLPELTESFYQSIRTVFPNAQMIGNPTISPLIKRQTEVFRPGSKGCSFEVDYLIRLFSQN